jgi:hypothetical protein
LSFDFCIFFLKSSVLIGCWLLCYHYVMVWLWYGLIMVWSDYGMVWLWYGLISHLILCYEYPSSAARVAWSGCGS